VFSDQRLVCCLIIFLLIYFLSSYHARIAQLVEHTTDTGGVLSSSLSTRTNCLWYNIFMNEIKTTPKDFFLNLGATIALYVAVGALINLLFSIINYYFPDQLAGYFYGNVVATPISMLVVLIPILYVIEYLIKKDIQITPQKADLWVRRWRIYLTLFLTGIVLAGDLIALINTYLNGEISSRFVYKFLAILVVIGIVFAYYLLERINIRQNVKTILAYAGIVVIVAAIVIGFITVGSPTKQRSMRFDMERINDLQNLQWQILSYWQQKEGLPTSLDVLKDPLSGTIVPNDPKTDEPYEYRVKGPLTFELCANFDLKYEDTKGRGESGYGRGGYFPMPMAYDMSYPYMGENENWKHEAGRTCFERTIDPEKYDNTPRPISESI
jgi:hypothetical protein